MTLDDHRYSPNQLSALRLATEPKVGDLWTDNDPRSIGRYFCVVDTVIDSGQKYALIRGGKSGTGKRGRIGFWRFVQTRNTGYTLVQRAEQAA